MDRKYNTDVSRRLYDYLCEILGNEDVVRTRRSYYASVDYFKIYENMVVISSGSKAEGLDMAGSDLDIMELVNDIHISDKKRKYTYLIPNNFVMDTEDTKPGFTQFMLDSWGIRKNVNEWCIWRGGELLLSSEKFKAYHLQKFNSDYGLRLLSNKKGNRFKIHGPCISDIEENLDNAFSVRCENWIEQAHPWVRRGRCWPSAELVSHITSYGVLFVPIGCKGSPNETIEWRISFSVAEKHLIYSFAHTQLLCYALLKVLLKEIIEKHATFKGLLCSYFLKTVVFWVSEEIPVSAWLPENIILCFSNCLRRLIYCGAYEILPHYFIIENNLFENRFNTQQHLELLIFLSDQYNKGIDCLLTSETMSKFFGNFNFVSSKMSDIDIACCKINVLNDISCGEKISTLRNVPFCRLTYSLWQGLKLNLNHFSFWRMFYLSCQCVKKPNTVDSECLNKYRYRQIKHFLPLLIIGVNTDAISGWLHVATHYYCNQQFKTGLQIITYVLQKYSTAKFVFDFEMLTSNYLDATEKEGLSRKCFKISDIYKHHVINILEFSSLFSLVPSELKREMRTDDILEAKPNVYAHFLSFMCWHHLKNNYKCRQALQNLQSAIVEGGVQYVNTTAMSFICFGIAMSLLGHNINAEICFDTSHYILTLEPDVVSDLYIPFVC